MKKDKINKDLKPDEKEDVNKKITSKEATKKEVDDATLNLDPDENSWGSIG